MKMDKNDFMLKLRAGLTGNVTPAEVERLLSYYAEMIADLMEDGVSEQEAVAKMGDPNAIVFEAVDNAHVDKAAQNANDDYAQEQTAAHEQRSEWVPPAYLRKAHRTNWALIILLIVTAPLCGSIGFGILAVLFSIDIAIWCIPFAGGCLAGGLGIGGLMTLFASPLAILGVPFIGITQLGLGLGLIGAALLAGWVTYKFSAVFLKAHMALVHWALAKLNRGKEAWS